MKGRTWKTAGVWLGTVVLCLGIWAAFGYLVVMFLRALWH